MEIHVSTGDISDVRADALVVGVFEGDREWGAPAASVNRAMSGALQPFLDGGEISGKLGENTVIYSLGKLAAGIVCIVGLGKREHLTDEKLRRVAAEVCRALRAVRARSVAVVLLGAGIGKISHEAAAQAMSEGSLLGLYRFRKYLTGEPERGEITDLTVVECEEVHVAAVERGLRQGQVIAEAVAFARDMVNEPANVLTPTEMATRALEYGKAAGLACSVLEREQMASMGMGALLGVAQGSDQPPKLIVMKYRGNPSSQETWAWVGKAITFDSGGISIKPSDGMGDMKGDMAGGAAVIAAMGAAARLRARVNITGVVPAVENLPSGKAYRPGDILKSMSGKTVEVVSTDAEGRLVLADALTYAVKEGLGPVVDLATLTGACHVALGDVCSGAFGNNQEWTDRVVRAGELAGECLWPMPMFEDYKDQLKSPVADLKNSGNRWGGAITGALFLAEFAGSGPWVHLDIAGTAQMDKERGYLVKGATGVGVRTLVNLALSAKG